MRRVCTATKRRMEQMRDCRARQHKHTKGNSPFIVLNFIVSFGTVGVVTLCQSSQPIAIQRQMKLASTHTHKAHMDLDMHVITIEAGVFFSYLSLTRWLILHRFFFLVQSFFFEFYSICGLTLSRWQSQKMAKWKRQIKFI